MAAPHANPIKPRRLVLAGLAATAALGGGSAAAQLPVAFDAPVVPIAPPVSEAAYPAHDYGKDGVPSRDDRTGTTTWRVVEATGNCCENYLTTSSDGRLLDFGGTYINYSDDRGLTWYSVRTLTPLVNGEGTISIAPGGDVVGVGWDPYSGDHLQAFKYEADTGKWQYTETPIHQPFYDREWVAVVPGPFTIDGRTVEYITFLKGGYPTKELWYYSTDGLNYVQVSSKFVDATLNGQTQTAVTSARSDLDWIQANTNGGMTPLGGGSILAAPDYPASSSAWAVFDPASFSWKRATHADGSVPTGLYQADSLGRLHNVIPQGSRFTYRWSADNGATWAALEVPLPNGATIEEIDFRANAAAAVAAVVVHAQDSTTGSDLDVVYKLGIGRKDATPRLQRQLRVGLGDVNATGGVGNDVRLDFQTVAVFPDGRVAVSFLDSTTTSASPTTGGERPSPAVAIELGTKLTGVRVTEPATVAGPAQAPILTTVLVGAPGAGQRVAPVTSTYFEFAVPPGVDNAAMLAQATQLLPADIDLYLQRELSPGLWSGDLASGTSSSLTDEVLQSGRLVAGSRYRIEVHNWAGPPNSVGLDLTFFNSEGVAGT